MAFTEADSLWDLNAVYHKLSEGKHAPLTPTEKEYTRGLLLGNGPNEMAQALGKDVIGVRVFLSRTLYPYAKEAFGQPVDSKNFAELFREDGFVRSKEPSPEKPIKILPPDPDPDPRYPSGQEGIDSPWYIDRPPAEERCYRTILQPGALIRIRAARQMGKTSLMMRILHHAQQHDHQTVFLSFQEADDKTFIQLERCLQWFCACVTYRLELPDRVETHWDTMLGNKVSCESYFEKYLLSKLDRPLVLALDEVDRLFDYPEVAEDFLGLLRVWNEKGKQRGIWQQFKLILVHSTEVYIPMAITQSPFNVGLPIELPDFNLQQVQELVRRHRLALSDVELHQLMALVGGHPFLIRLALYRLTCGHFGLKQLLANAPTEAGVYQEHLRRHGQNLEHYAELGAALRRVVAADAPVRLESIHAFKLQSMGLVNLCGNEVTLRYGLYREYFRDRFRSA